MIIKTYATAIVRCANERMWERKPYRFVLDFAFEFTIKDQNKDADSFRLVEQIRWKMRKCLNYAHRRVSSYIVTLLSMLRYVKANHGYAII